MTAYVEPSDATRSIVSRTLERIGPHRRVLIAGGPRVGKSTLSELAAQRLGTKPLHTDDTIELGWSNASAVVATWFDKPGPWVIEGVALPRALRKWLAANPEGRPCDVVFWSNDNKVDRNSGQEAMAKGCDTVWVQVRPLLRERGVTIEAF